MSGQDLLTNAALNKSTAFKPDERQRLGLRGLLPPHVSTQEKQLDRVLENLRRKSDDIEKYVFLTALQDRNERLFYRAVMENISEVMPLIYTPTVGQACREFAHIFRRPRGFYITPDDRGDIRSILNNWREEDVRIVVVTDGERILGLGDLGANGMGIPIGKLALYVACAGIEPSQCLPVMLDVGTGNVSLREDPLYLGIPKPRLEGDDYTALVDEFVEAVQDRYPKALIQFEDFLTPNAYRLLRRYRDRVLCFNDDIQGTAAVTLAGIMASTRVSGVPFKDLRIMFLGAGSAATGIADLTTAAFEVEGLSEEEAKQRIWFVDIDGLLTSRRQTIAEHSKPYAHDHEPMGFLDAISEIKPHILIGATGAPGLFNEAVIRRMAEFNERPGIFALSNPTSRAECTAQHAYDWSDGRAIFVSGSPFAPVERNGQVFKPGQGNNAYIFPGIGLGAITAQAATIPEELFLVAARSLSEQVQASDLEAGSLFPPLDDILKVSWKIAADVAGQARALGLARADLPDDIHAHIQANAYDPRY
ncbi:MAG: NAD-dependent malic enzyme [Pseudomonadota bacterium]